MHPPPPRRFIAIFASRCRFGRPGFATVLLGARILVACALPPLAFAHESHLVGPPAAEEATFLKENDVAMARMMNDMAAKPSGDIEAANARREHEYHLFETVKLPDARCCVPA